MANKNHEISMDLGLIPLTVNFTGGKEPVTVMFNPADVDIMRRISEVQKNIKEKVEIYNNNKIDKEADYILQINEINKMIYEAIDYVFNAPISEQVFKYCSPITIINGETVAEQFLRKIAPFISQTIEKEQKKFSKNQDKYLNKYME